MEPTVRHPSIHPSITKGTNHPPKYINAHPKMRLTLVLAQQRLGLGHQLLQ